MPSCNYPTKPWLLDHILQKQKNRSAILLVIEEITTSPDGTIFFFVGDGELYLMAKVSAEVSRNFESAKKGDTLEQCLIVVTNFDIILIKKQTKEKCEYIMDIKKFVLWSDQKGFSTKMEMSRCESHPEIQEQIDELWAKDQLSKKSQEIFPKCDSLDSTEKTVNSINLSALLEQFGNSNPNDESRLSQPFTDAGSLVNVSVVALIQNFKNDSVQEFLISPKDEQKLNSIPDWQGEPQCPAGNESEKRASDNPVLAGSSTLKKKSFSSHLVSPKDVVSTDPTRNQSKADPRADASSQELNDLEVAEEIRLLDLSRTSKVWTERERKCPPEGRKNRPPDKEGAASNSPKSSKAVSYPKGKTACTVADPKRMIPESSETSSEIPLSGKVAVNNLSKSTPDDSRPFNFLDHSLDTDDPAFTCGGRWNNLDLSSIESEKQSGSQGEVQACKRMRLAEDASPTSESARCRLSRERPSEDAGPTSESARCRLSRERSGEDAGPTSESARSRLSRERSGEDAGSTSESARCLLGRERSSNDAKRKMAATYSVGPKTVICNPLFKKTVSVNNGAGTSSVEKVIASPPSATSADVALRTNLKIVSSSLNSVLEKEIRSGIDAKLQELWPKHETCRRLLSSDRLSVGNNLNKIRLPKETLEIIQSYWRRSKNHLGQENQQQK